MEREGKGGAAGNFGSLLRAHRGAAGLTQEELATRAGLSTEAISMLERGSRRAPRAATVQSLATALKLDAEQRDEFAATAAGSDGAPATSSRSDAGDCALHEPVSPQEGTSRPAWFRLPARLLAGVLILVAALGLVTYLTWSHDPVRQQLIRSDPEPVISDLSVTPSTLHPSPANYALIKFHLNADARVTLTVLDSHGTVVKQFLNEDIKPEGVVSRPYYGYNGATTLSPGRYTVVVTAATNGSSETLRASLTVLA